MTTLYLRDVDAASLLVTKAITVSGTGWQRFDFDTPISVTADTIYLIYYFQNEGANGTVEYPFTSGYFASAGVTSGNLYALSNAEAAALPLPDGNGVFRYEASGSNTGPPSATFNSTNYWIDPIFQASP